MSVLELVETFERVNAVVVPREIVGRREAGIPSELPEHKQKAAPAA